MDTVLPTLVGTGQVDRARDLAIRIGAPLRATRLNIILFMERMDRVAFWNARFLSKEAYQQQKANAADSYMIEQPPFLDYVLYLVMTGNQAAYINARQSKAYQSMTTIFQERAAEFAFAAGLGPAPSGGEKNDASSMYHSLSMGKEDPLDCDWWFAMGLLYSNQVDRFYDIVSIDYSNDVWLDALFHFARLFPEREVIDDAAKCWKDTDLLTFLLLRRDSQSRDEQSLNYYCDTRGLQRFYSLLSLELLEELPLTTRVSTAFTWEHAKIDQETFEKIYKRAHLDNYERAGGFNDRDFFHAVRFPIDHVHTFQRFLAYYRTRKESNDADAKAAFIEMAQIISFEVQIVVFTPDILPDPASFLDQKARTHGVGGFPVLVGYDEATWLRALKSIDTVQSDLFFRLPLNVLYELSDPILKNATVLRALLAKAPMALRNVAATFDPFVLLDVFREIASVHVRPFTDGLLETELGNWSHSIGQRYPDLEGDIIQREYLFATIVMEFDPDFFERESHCRAALLRRPCIATREFKKRLEQHTRADV